MASAQQSAYRTLETEPAPKPIHPRLAVAPAPEREAALQASSTASSKSGSWADAPETEVVFPFPGFFAGIDDLMKRSISSHNNSIKHTGSETATGSARSEIEAPLRLIITQNARPIRSVSSVGFTVWAASLLMAKLLVPDVSSPALNSPLQKGDVSLQSKGGGDTEGLSARKEVDASLALGGLVDGKTVIELGCGCGGIAGIAALLLGAKSVLFSDRKDIIDLCQKNVAQNLRRLFPGSMGETLLTRCSFQEIMWGETDVSALAGSADVILAADTVYLAKAVVPLLRCARELCGEPDRGTVVLLAFEHHDGIALRVLRRYVGEFFVETKLKVCAEVMASDPRFADSLMSVCMLRPREDVPSLPSLVDISDSSDSSYESDDLEDF